MARPFSLSVALVTRNRAASVRRCLESWRRQTVSPDEIVVSDDSDDHLADETARVAAAFGCKYIRGPRKGLYANRNHASLACAGTHILSADDDHTHPPDDPSDDWEERYYVLAGHGTLTVDGERRAIGPDDAVLVPTGVHHGLYADRGETLRILLIFGKPQPR